MAQHLALPVAAAAAQLLHRAGAPRLAVFLATFGPLLVAAGVVPALVLAHSPSWFVAAGLPGNLMWLAGMVMLALWARRTRALPGWVALVGLPLVVVCGVLMAEIGGGLVAAVVLAMVARPAPALRLGASLGGAGTTGRAAV